MIRITQLGVSSEPGDIERLKKEFDETGCAVMPGFLTPEVLNPILKRLETSTLGRRNELDRGTIFGTTLLADEADPARLTTIFVLNTPRLLRIAEAVTGCGPVENYMGRLHRTVASPDQMIDWHNDISDYRVAAININLSVKPYSGGLFRLRGPGSEVYTEFGQMPPGDAFFFRISPGWSHCLTPVEKGERTVAVGWFRTQPSRTTFAREWFGYVPPYPVPAASEIPLLAKNAVAENRETL